MARFRWLLSYLVTRLYPKPYVLADLRTRHGYARLNAAFNCFKWSGHAFAQPPLCNSNLPLFSRAFSTSVALGPALYAFPRSLEPSCTSFRELVETKAELVGEYFALHNCCHSEYVLDGAAAGIVAFVPAAGGRVGYYPSGDIRLVAFE